MKEGRNSFVRCRCQKFIIASLDTLRSAGRLTSHDVPHMMTAQSPLECEGCYKYQIKTILIVWVDMKGAYLSALNKLSRMPQMPIIPYKKRIRKASSPSHSLISKFLVTPSQTTFKSPLVAASSSAVATDVSTFTVVNLNSREEARGKEGWQSGDSFWNG